MEINTIYNMDVMDGLAKLPDNSINMVLTDPPYNIGKAAWDKIDNYVEWCGGWLKECERVLKPNGVLVFWHNDLPATAKLVDWMDENTCFLYNSFGLWHKPYYRNQSWKNTNGNTTLRSFFNIFEWFLAFEMSENDDHTGLERVLSNPACFRSLKAWYEGEKNRLGLTNKDIGEAYTAATGRKPYMLRHYFQDSQFEIPTREVWESVYEPLGFASSYEALRAEYETLRAGYETLRSPFNTLPGISYSNYFRDDEEKAKMGKKLPHPCMKPLSIIERLVLTYSREGDVVLDCFLGSGQTAIAAEMQGRKWVGIEKDAEYCDMAQRRIEEVRHGKA